MSASAARAIVEAGTEAQKAAMAAAHRIGRDHHQLRADRARCRLGLWRGEDARRGQAMTGDGYRLRGTKRYITNADKADLFTVMARTGGEGAARRVGVPRAARLPGLTRRRARKEDGPAGRARLRRQFRRCRRAGRQPARRGGRGLQGRDARARSRAAAYLGGLRRRRRTADRRLRRLCDASASSSASRSPTSS